MDGCGTFATFIKIMLPDARPILTSCFLFSFVWQWTDSFYSRMFLGDIKLLSNRLTSITGLLSDYLTLINGTGSKPTIAYGQMMISTGMIMAVIPLLLIPSCYDADTAEKIAFAYNLWTNPTPGYEDAEDWKESYYTLFRDERAVEETLEMMYDEAEQNNDYLPFVYGTIIKYN